MVSSRSSTSCRNASSTVETGSALVRSRGSGYSRITSFVMGVMRWISCFWPEIVAKVPPLLNLMPELAAHAALAIGKNGRHVPVLGGRSAVYQPPGHHKTGDSRERNECNAIRFLPCY